MSRKCSPGEDKKEGTKSGEAKALARDEEKPEANQQQNLQSGQVKEPESPGQSGSLEK